MTEYDYDIDYCHNCYQMTNTMRTLNGLACRKCGQIRNSSTWNQKENIAEDKKNEYYVEGFYNGMTEALQSVANFCSNFIEAINEQKNQADQNDENQKKDLVKIVQRFDQKE